MEPARAFTIKPLTIGKKHIPAHTIVWVLQRSEEYVEIEFRDCRGRVKADAVIPYPVEGPGLALLQGLDPCFGLGKEAFFVEYSDQDNLFQILRCKEHGNRFLRDTRGGMAMYTTLTLLQDDDGEDPKTIWTRYHFMPESLLHLQGRTL